jgi:hypothetical protein
MFRHAFHFRESDATELENWTAGRPSITKDFALRRINRPSEKGLVVDCSRAWECLEKYAGTLAAHTKRAINSSNLILGVFTRIMGILWVFADSTLA